MRALQLRILYVLQRFKSSNKSIKPNMLNKLKSIFTNKCPQCLQGDVFKEKGAYKLKTFDKMNASCSHCHLKYEREVGFFYGAMYVSYGLTVGLGVLMFLLMVLLLKLSIVSFLICFSLSVLLLMPLVYRLSRLIWINIFVKFK